MRVYLRHESQTEATFFTDCEYDQVNDVIAELKRGGGVYYEGSHWTDLSYQFLLDEQEAYAEIIIGSDGD